ncbi:MAG: YqgE/AlgH family protein [Rhodospirillales bacterium]|nr:YqgE/AlgH family protein [Rhodospirillales bacterium]
MEDLFGRQASAAETFIVGNDRATKGNPAVQQGTASAFVAGQFLLANPRITDPRFAEAVIYVVSHDADGAMGLILNQTYGTGRLRSLLAGFGMMQDNAHGSVTLHAGGPVEPTRGFVLHSDDYAGPSTHILTGGLALSTGKDVLEALAADKGPRNCLVFLGYAGWGPGQLEGELAHDDWLTATADRDTVLSIDPDHLWKLLFARAGTPL